MKKARFLCSMVFPFALFLSACGGGGGSKNPPSSSSPSTNIPSASSVPSSVASSSTSAISKLTIKGGVGASLSGGEVVFTIGTQTAKAEIDSSSRYVAALEVSKENLDKPIIAIGSGKGADEWIQLAAVMPSTERLTELAGSDDTLDEYEYFGINLTALSTAEYAEIITNESPLTSDAERKSAIYGLHPTRAVEHAGMVMQLLTDIDTPLPTEVTTTLGYLLNSNLAETKLEILRIENEPLLKELVNNLQQDPTQTRVTGKKLSGKYFLESLHSQYFLTFNEEGSGVLVAKLLTSEIWNNEDGPIKSANFTWGRKGKLVEILLEQPLHYRSSVRTLNSNIDCDYSYTSERELCAVTIKSLSLNLISEYDERYIAGLTIYGEVKRENNDELLYSGKLNPNFARIVSTSKLAGIEVADLIGHEWVSDEYSYLFSDDGKVRQKNLVTQTEAAVDWTLTGNQISLPNAEIWVSHLNKAGFNALTIQDGAVLRQPFIKRMQVNMAESDWVGRWTTYPLNVLSASHDVNANKTWRDGFEQESAGSWSVTSSHVQTAIANASWKMIRDVVAIHDDKYFVSYCQGLNASPFVALNCYITKLKHSEDFDTAVFWRAWSHPAFNEVLSNSPLFTLQGSYLIERDADNNSYTASTYFEVSANKIYKSNSKTIVELTSADRDEIVLCEYSSDATCHEANKERYVRGIEVLLSVGEGGRIFRLVRANSDQYGYGATFSNSVDKIIMLSRGVSERFEIEPFTGYSIGSVTGCGGGLFGHTYEVPGLQKNCEIVVTFNKN